VSDQTTYNNEIVKIYNNDITLSVKGKCNLACLFCNLHQIFPEMDYHKHYNELIVEIDKIANNGYNHINLGVYHYEPTTFPFLQNVIKYARSKNIIDQKLSTNGMQTADIEYLRILKENGLTSVNISIFEYDDQSSSIFCNSENVLSSKLKTLENCRNLGIKTYISILLMRANYKKLDSIIEVYSKYLEKGVTISHIYPGMGGRVPFFLPPLTGVMEVINECLPKWKTYNFKIDNIPICIQKSRNVSLKNLKFQNSFKGVFPKYCNNCNQQTKCCGLHQEYIDIYGTTELTDKAIIDNPIELDELTELCRNEHIEGISNHINNDLEENQNENHQIAGFIGELKNVLSKAGNTNICGYSLQDVKQYKNDHTVKLTFNQTSTGSEFHILILKEAEEYYFKTPNYFVQYIGSDLEDIQKKQLLDSVCAIL